MVVIAGGTDNPYNYNGVGYDGIPSFPRSPVIAYDVSAERWITLEALAAPSMDHRGLPVLGLKGWIVGGMGASQIVRADVTAWRVSGEGSTP